MSRSTAFQIHELNCLDKREDVIEEILSLQKQWIANRSSAQLENGFLISEFDPKELRQLLSNYGRLYYLSEENNKIDGYILMTPIKEFTDLISDPIKGVYDQKLDLISSKSQYLYQIAVRKEKFGLGIGSVLLNHVLQNSLGPIVTDVLTIPIRNEQSLRFFKRHHFVEAGELKLAEYRDFGKLVSQVLIWNP